MGSLHSLRWHLVDAPDSWATKRRGQRWRWLVEAFPDLSEMTVLDLGGRLDTWQAASVRGRHVHVVNLEPPPSEVPIWAEVDVADACDLPAAVRRRHYDLVFSNSVIEHVGGHERRLRFAEAVRSLGDRYWVQTPYRFFPIEPHWVAPGMQFLPSALRTSVAYRWPLGHTPAVDRDAARDAALWVELLDRTQMRHYFPDAELRAERLIGMTKSLIAVRRPAASRTASA
jgi:hypothetical protein